MVNVILTLSLLTSVLCTTRGQSTAGDNSDCVYSFRVPKSDCGQTPGPSVDDQIWKSSVIALQAQVSQLVTGNRQLTNDNKQLASDNKQFANDIKQLASDVTVLREHNNKLLTDVAKLQTTLATVTKGRKVIVVVGNPLICVRLSSSLNL